MGRDPVDIAEQQRDYDETYGDSYTRMREREEYEANKADLERYDVEPIEKISK